MTSWADLTEEEQLEDELHYRGAVVIIVSDMGKVAKTAVLRSTATWADVLAYGLPPPVVRIDAPLFTSCEMLRAFAVGSAVCAIVVRAAVL